MIRIIWRIASQRGEFCATVRKFSGYSCRMSSKGDIFGGYFKEMQEKKRRKK